jgi:hypothetical protein
MDGDGFGSGITVISDRVVADDQDDDNNNNGVVDDTKLRLSAVRCKRPRTTAPIGLASAASTVPAPLESTNLEEPLSCALIAASDLEREIREINEEMVNDRSTNDSNDEDYNNISNATSSKIGGQLQSRKRVRQTKDIRDNDIEALSTYYLDVSD